MQVSRVEDLPTYPLEIEPDTVHLPGIFVQRVVEVGDTGKQIEKRTVRPATRGAR